MSAPTADAAAPPRPELAKRTSTAPSSNRHSKLPSTPPPPLSLHPRSLPAENALIVGTQPVSLAANAVVHPYARLDSSVAPISIGESAVVWEKAVVGVLAEDGETGLVDGAEGQEDKGVVIGRYVTIGSGAVVAAASVGDGSVIDTGARVGRECVLGEVRALSLVPCRCTGTSVADTLQQYCRVAPNVVLPANTHLPAYTVVTAAGMGQGSIQTRTDVSSRDNERVRMLKQKGHDKQIEMMRKLLKVNLAKWGFAG